MTSAVTNQKTSIDYGLIKLKEVNIRYFNEKPELLKMGDNAEEALIILSNAFGVSEITPVRVVPIFGINLVININLLPHIIEKRQNGRERFALFAQITLNQPYEVWQTLYDDGSYRYVYIGLFRESKYHIAVVISIFPDGHVLWNYMNGELRSIEKLRKGILQYSAESSAKK